jgi:hypothetical protein
LSQRHEQTRQIADAKLFAAAARLYNAIRAVLPGNSFFQLTGMMP